MSGPLFGRYRSLGLLGEGGMALVHLAEDPILHRCVALKVIRSQLSMQPEWLGRFHQEATTVARLGNPHVVQVFDMGSRDGEEFLVMEFLDRGCLDRNLVRQGGRIGALEAACVAVQAAGGLRAAHEAGVVHRDVKPENLLLSREGVVKVADFGIASLAGEATTCGEGEDVPLGSPKFMAPEQVEGGALTGKVDVFALAGVLYRAVSGRLPFDAPLPAALMWRIASQDALPLSEVAPECPQRLSKIVGTMHARDPEQRPDMTEVEWELRAFLAECGVLDPAEHLRSAFGFPSAVGVDLQLSGGN